jgi:hypothetical protein
VPLLVVGRYLGGITHSLLMGTKSMYRIIIIVFNGSTALWFLAAFSV